MAESVFISYRHDGADYMAQILYDRLTARGYDVFYDIEVLKAGAFDDSLLKEIERCDYILAVLPENGLDPRDDGKEDWVRRELAHAFAHQKTVVPVLLRGFDFPDDLPEEIAMIKKCQGIKIENMSFLNAKIDKLIDIMTKGNTLRKIPVRSGPALISNVCTIGGDGSNAFPTDSSYTRILNVDIYPYVYFHATLAKPILTHKKIKCGYKILGADNREILEYETEIEATPGVDRLSMSWRLKKHDGSFVPSGQYTVYVWVENSCYFDCSFHVTSHQDPEPYVIPRNPVSHGRSDIEERVFQLEKNLSSLKGLLLTLLMWAGYFIMKFTEQIDYFYVTVLGITAFFIGLFMLISHTRKYLIKNWFIALLICVVGLPLYTVYLAVRLFLSMKKREQWKIELKKLRKFL